MFKTIFSSSLAKHQFFGGHFTLVLWGYIKDHNYGLSCVWFCSHVGLEFVPSCETGRSFKNGWWHLENTVYFLFKMDSSFSCAFFY